MTDLLNRKNRRSIRLQGYDYSQAGAYYITICTQDRLCLFGNVIHGKMVLNDSGMMVEHWLHEVENKFKEIEIAEHVIMPNHVHAIVINHGVGVVLCVDPNNEHVDPNNERDLTMDTRMSTEGVHTGAPLPTVVQWFKTMTTNAYIRGVKELNWRPFNRTLWQRNYYEHIIRQWSDTVRDGNDYDRIVQYIRDNPMNWEQALWESFQSKIDSFVKTNGGDSSIDAPYKPRPDWDKVLDVLEGRAPLSTLSKDCPD